MEREQKLINSTIILAIGTFLPKLSVLVTLPILTSYLSKTEYGSYDIITVLVSLILPTATLQIQTAVFRTLIDQRHDCESINETISSVFAFAIPVAITTLFLCVPFSRILNLQGVLFICCYFFVDLIYAIVRQIARGLDYTKEYSTSAIISSCVMIVMVYFLVKVFQLGLSGVIIALLISNLVAVLFLSAKINLTKYIHFSFISRTKIKEMLLYSWPMVPNGLSMWIMRLSDRLIIAGIMGVSWTAIYGVSNKIPGFLNLAQTSFTLAWQENASIVSKDNDAGEYYSIVFKNLFNLCAGFMGLLIAFTPLMFMLFIRGDYDEAYPQIPILMLSEFFFCLATFFGGIYIAFKRTRSVGISTILAAVCNIVINLLFIKKWGLYAASISTLISYIFLLIFRIIDVQKIVKIHVPIKHVMVVLIVIAVQLYMCSQKMVYIDIANILLGTIVFVVLNKEMISKFYIYIKGIMKGCSK